MKYINVKTSRITLICAIVLLGSVLVEMLKAQESLGSAGLFLRMGAGARSLSMGGAFVGLADDPSATYWNPAGLAQLRTFGLEVMNANLPFDRSLNFVSAVLPVKGIMTIGASWVGFRVDDIEGRQGNTADPDYTFGSSQNGFLISVGKSISPLISVGGNVKFIRNELDNFSANGLGFDAAVMIRPAQRLRIGLMAQDIGTDYRWNSGFTEGVPMNMRAGAALEIYDGITLAADVNKSTGLDPTLHFGAEINPLMALPIRVGWDDRQISGGAGLIFSVSRHSVALNYAYSNDRALHDAIHRVSLVFNLNASRRFTSGRTTTGSRYDDLSLPKRDSARRVKVTATVLNVRKGPGTSYQVMAKVYRDEKFEAFETRGSWRKIKLRTGEMGWVHQNYIVTVK